MLFTNIISIVWIALVGYPEVDMDNFIFLKMEELKSFKKKESVRKTTSR